MNITAVWWARVQGSGVWCGHSASLAAGSLEGHAVPIRCLGWSALKFYFFPYTSTTSYFYLSSSFLSSCHPQSLLFLPFLYTKWVWQCPLPSLTPSHSALHIVDILHIMVEWMNGWELCLIFQHSLNVFPISELLIDVQLSSVLIMLLAIWECFLPGAEALSTSTRLLAISSSVAILTCFPSCPVSPISRTDL